MPGQLARSVVIALHKFFGKNRIGKVVQGPTDLAEIIRMQMPLGLSLVRAQEGSRVVCADEGK